MSINKAFWQAVGAVVFSIGEALADTPHVGVPDYLATPPAVTQVVAMPIYRGDPLTEAYDEYRKEYARTVVTMGTTSAMHLKIPSLDLRL